MSGLAGARQFLFPTFFFFGQVLLCSGISFLSLITCTVRFRRCHSPSPSRFFFFFLQKAKQNYFDTLGKGKGKGKGAKSDDDPWNMYTAPEATAKKVTP